MDSFTLYDNTASVAAQKVRIVLAEKGQRWTTVPIDLRNGDVMRADYLALNPRGVVPTLLHNGAVLTESNVIIEYLEDCFPQPALRPAGAVARARMRWWMRRVDDEIHRATGTVSMAIYIRHAHLAKTQAERDAYFAAMPDRERATRQQAAIAAGLDTPGFAPALRSFAALIDEIEVAVAADGWLAGDGFSLAEVAVAPYVTRLEMLAMPRLWEGGRRPGFTRWWQQVKERTTWQREVRDAFVPAACVAMRTRGTAAWPTVAGILGMPPEVPSVVP